MESETLMGVMLIELTIQVIFGPSLETQKNKKAQYTASALVKIKRYVVIIYKDFISSNHRLKH